MAGKSGRDRANAFKSELKSIMKKHKVEYCEYYFERITTWNSNDVVTSHGFTVDLCGLNKFQDVDDLEVRTDD